MFAPVADDKTIYVRSSGFGSCCVQVPDYFQPISQSLLPKIPTSDFGNQRVAAVFRAVACAAISPIWRIDIAV